MKITAAVVSSGFSNVSDSVFSAARIVRKISLGTWMDTSLIG